MNATLEGGEWSPAYPSCNLPWETPGTHFAGGWVGPMGGLDGQKIYNHSNVNNITSLTG